MQLTRIVEFALNLHTAIPQTAGALNESVYPIHSLNSSTNNSGNTRQRLPEETLWYGAKFVGYETEHFETFKT